MESAIRVLDFTTCSAHPTFPGFSRYDLSQYALQSLSRSLQLERSASMGVDGLIPGEPGTGLQTDLRAPDPNVSERPARFHQNKPNLIPTPLGTIFNYQQPRLVLWPYP